MYNYIQISDEDEFGQKLRGGGAFMNSRRWLCIIFFVPFVGVRFQACF